MEKRVAAYREQEQNIYAALRAKGQEGIHSGLIPDKIVTMRMGGICIIARHLLAHDRLLPYLNDIGRLLPCAAYTTTTEHSPLCYHEQPRFDFRLCSYNYLFQGLASRIKQIVASLSHTERSTCVVNYGRPFFSRSMVLLPGEASAAYVELLLKIGDACKEVSGMLQTSWGTHIPVAHLSRYCNPTEARPFFSYIEQATAPGEIAPSSIDVCMYKFTDTGIQFNTADRFHLS